jgi:hypothetical protein
MMAGVAGFEPTSAGVKVPCLTTWLHPNVSLEDRKHDRISSRLVEKMGWNMGIEPMTSSATN